MTTGNNIDAPAEPTVIDASGVRDEMLALHAGGDEALDGLQSKELMSAVATGPIGKELQELGFERGHWDNYHPWIGFHYFSKEPNLPREIAESIAAKAKAIVERHGRTTMTGEENPTDELNPAIDQDWDVTLGGIRTSVYVHVYVRENDWRKDMFARSRRIDVATVLQEAIMPPHQAEAMRIFGQHHRAAIQGLELFDIPTQGAPKLEEVALNISPEALALIINRIRGVDLLLLPPSAQVSISDLIAKLDRHVGRRSAILNPLRAGPFITEYNNDKLWRNGSSEPTTAWSAYFVDNRKEVPYDLATQHGKSDIDQIVALLEQFTSEGVTAMSGLAAHLLFVMQKLSLGHTVDEKWATVVNAEVVAKGRKDPETMIATSRWIPRHGELHLQSHKPMASSVDLRLRRAFRVL